MTFASEILSQTRPTSLRKFSLPRRKTYFPSPADWRDEVLYFLLPDRFSDGQENSRKLLERQNLNAARPNLNEQPWRFDLWAESGGDRWQGGTLKGIKSQLGYLKNLGVTTIWVGPIFKQRGHLDTYHGYGIQDFLDVDPRFGDRQDLVDLVDAAHTEGLHIILDIIFNHSGANWVYPGGQLMPPIRPFPEQYDFGSFLDTGGQQMLDTHAQAILDIQNSEDGVWPTELQRIERYTRAGSGDLGAGNIDDPNAEFRRSDFLTLRDFQLDAPGLLNDLARCYKYWIALTDCDGFRIDTLKHVSTEQARNFCGTIKEFAANLGKKDFFLVGEIAGGDFNQDRYLDVLEQNLNAALDIGEMRLTLNGVAKGLMHPTEYFKGFDPGNAVMGSHRNLGRRHVSILDDHDHVFGQKIRFSSEAASDRQVVAGVALQLFTLGIPCIYYGTEQALTGPEPSMRKFLPDWRGSDRYLREAMFGPIHPRKSGKDGLLADSLDNELPGFGPFGTAGQHCFDRNHPTYIRIAALAAIRKQYPVVRYGRQYLRPISFVGKAFEIYGPGEIVAWSRILDDEEVLCILNAHGTESRGADVLIDASLNPSSSFMTVIANTAQAANSGFAGTNLVGSRVSVERTPDGKAFVAIRDVQPSEVLMLTNHPEEQ